MKKIKNCSVIIFVISKRHAKTIINRMICFRDTIIFSFCSQFCAKIHHFNFFENKDFFFESKNVNFGLYAHVIKIKISNVLLRNDENKTIKILRNFRLSRIVKLDYSNVYQMIENVLNLIVRQIKQFYQNVYFQKLLKVCLFDTKKNFIVENSAQTLKIENEIIIHDLNLMFIRQLIKFVNDYSMI